MQRGGNEQGELDWVGPRSKGRPNATAAAYRIASDHQEIAIESTHPPNPGYTPVLETRLGKRPEVAGRDHSSHNGVC